MYVPTVWLAGLGACLASAGGLHYVLARLRTRRTPAAVTVGDIAG